MRQTARKVIPQCEERFGFGLRADDMLPEKITAIVLGAVDSAGVRERERDRETEVRLGSDQRGQPSASLSNKNNQFVSSGWRDQEMWRQPMEQDR
jgi:hypothetical protein